MAKSNKIVTFPSTAEEWNRLSVEERFRILFHDFWLNGADTNCMWYHYTTIDALHSMISRSGVEFWATQSRFLNDSVEIQVGINKLADILPKNITHEKLKNRYNCSVFLSCFSLAKDSVPMWNTYAQAGNGIALGFEPHIPSTDDYRILKVIYEGTEDESLWRKQTIRLAERNSNFGTTQLLSSIVYLPMALKNNAFEYEHEIRMVCEKNEINFRSRNGLLIPYKKFTIDISHLKEIMIGPTADADRQQFAIELLLRKYNIQGVNITRSAVPLRNG